MPDEPAIAKVRERMTRVGLHPFPLPLGLDVDKWLRRAKTPWDAYPDTGCGKMDAESCGVSEALAHPNVELRTNARVERLLLEPDGKRVAGAEVSTNGERKTIRARIVVLAAGAVNSAALLLALSRGRARQPVGRGRPAFHEPQLLGRARRSTRRTINDSIYQKTLGINDFYLDDGHGGPPLGNIQLLGRVTAPILKASLRWRRNGRSAVMSRRSVDWYAMSEDLPNPESRVTVEGGRIRLDWKRSNWEAHEGLVKAFKDRCARRATRSCCPSRSTAERRRTNAGRFASGSIPRRRRSIPSAAPWTIPISSSSTPRSCRRRRRSIPR